MNNIYLPSLYLWVRLYSLGGEAHSVLVGSECIGFSFVGAREGWLGGATQVVPAVSLEGEFATTLIINLLQEL